MRNAQRAATEPACHAVSVWRHFCTARAIDIVRRRKRYVPMDDQRAPEQKVPRDPIVVAEEAVSLDEAMAGLSAEDQEIPRMHYVEGLSQKEIAKRLDVPVTTVNNRLATARRRLREKLLESAAFAAA